MKKIFSLLTTAIFSLGVLSGCNSSQSDFEEALVTEKLNQEGYEMISSEDLAEEMSTDLVKDYERLDFANEGGGRTFSVDLMTFDDEATALSEEALQEVDRLVEGTFSSSNSRGLNGSIYMNVHTPQGEFAIGLAEEMFSLLSTTSN